MTQIRGIITFLEVFVKQCFWRSSEKEDKYLMVSIAFRERCRFLEIDQRRTANNYHSTGRESVQHDMHRSWRKAPTKISLPREAQLGGLLAG